MNRVERNGIALWEFQALSKEPMIRHFVSDRTSNPGGEPFTLSFSSTPDKDDVRKNRKLLARAMDVADNRLYFPSQVHLTKIVHVTPHTQTSDLLETDALITEHPDICIAVMSADCVPILLFDKRRNVIAAIHSGWRGTVAKILAKTLLELEVRYGTRGEDVLAAIGPSVSQDSYEVGSEVIDAVDAAFGSEHGLLIPATATKARLDLWKANVIQLQRFGVPETNIEISGMCTVNNNADFFSARRGDKGRFAAGIALR
jgi:YfiH family protein